MPFVSAEVDRCLTAQKDFDVVYRVRSRNVGVRWVRAQTCRLRFSRGGTGEMSLGFVTDIHENMSSSPHIQIVDRLLEACRLAEEAGETATAMAIHTSLVAAGQALAQAMVGGSLAEPSPYIVTAGVLDA